jgi:hypothetical protein
MPPRSGQLSVEVRNPRRELTAVVAVLQSPASGASSQGEEKRELTAVVVATEVVYR